MVQEPSVFYSLGQGIGYYYFKLDGVFCPHGENSAMGNGSGDFDYGKFPCGDCLVFLFPGEDIFKEKVLGRYEYQKKYEQGLNGVRGVREGRLL